MGNMDLPWSSVYAMHHGSVEEEVALLEGAPEVVLEVENPPPIPPPPPRPEDCPCLFSAEVLRSLGLDHLVDERPIKDPALANMGFT